MKQIKHTKQFQKRFKQRLSGNQKLIQQFHIRVSLFQDGVRGEPLRDHALKNSMKGYRSFWITGDIRVIYHEDADYYHFLDIGSHNQVYGK